MNPPTEQLIRDYLNRLSVAAKGRLGFRDRQALLDQTRARIEVDCGGVSNASAVQVRKALADLGDPIAIVEAEHARIAAGKEVAVGGRGPAGTGAVGTGAAATGAAGTGAKAGVRRTWPVAARPFLDAPVPAGEPTPDDVPGVNGMPVRGVPQEAVVPRPSTSPESSVEQAPGAQVAGQVAGQVPEDLAAELDEPIGLEPDVPASGRGEFRILSESGTPSARGGGRLAGVTGTTAGVLANAAQTAAGALWHGGGRLVAIAQRHKPEALAVVLLGVGGAVFPPIWLLGALICLTSKTWDIRDKWMGIALPVLIVIVGAALIVVVGGPKDSLSSYAYEAWLGAGRLSRAVAVVSAGYLLWRLHAGRRHPRQPPWNVPHKFG